MELMDVVDSDTSGGIPSTTAAGDEASSSYAVSYLESFLPAYQVVNQSTISGVADRYRAIKFAADASLALVGTGASWSDALRKTLVENSGRTGISREHEFARAGSVLSSSEMASTSPHERFPDLDGNDFCEPSGSFESTSWGRKLGAHRNYRNGLAGTSMRVSQRFAGRAAARNWSRSHRDAGRLAILRSLSSSRCKTRWRMVRRWSKPRAVVRKVKSLATRRRRLPIFPTKAVECVADQEQRFENGLVALQRLVPGGSTMDAEVLLDEAADFVAFLKLQVQALQSVATAVGIDS